MSRTNKVNPDHYKVAGRLSPDDLARERWKQQPTSLRRGRREKPLAPWMQPQAASQTPAWLEPPDEAPVEALAVTKPAPEPEGARRATRPAAARRRPAKAAKPTARSRVKTSTRAKKASAKSAKKRTAPAVKKTTPAPARRARRVTEKRLASRKRTRR